MIEAVNNIFGDAPVMAYVMEHKKIIDNLTNAIFLLDKNMRIRYVNPAAEEFLGTGLRKVKDCLLTDFIVDVDGDLIAHIQQSIQTSHPFTEREVLVKLIGATEMTVDCAITPMFTKEEQTECLLEITQVDRMLRISREEHLLSETQATQNMLRGLAHEIKNPLGGLRGAAQLLAAELDDKDLQEYTDVIISEADRLRKLVDRMFGPKITPIKQELNIHDVLQHIKYLANAEATSGIKIRTDYDPSIPALHADRDMLTQATLNIVRNALRAIGEQGEIILKTRVLRQYTIGDICHRLVVQISIMDNGFGVDEELKPQIFFPMVSGSKQGSGLGLPISQNLINLHGGLIEFDSIPGATEFRIMLPLNGADYFS